MLLVVDELPLEAHASTTRRASRCRCTSKIGLFQCLAMIPGVSRSGATIVGAMLLGADKRAAAEFSFFLAMPTMAGAFAYDLLKNYKTLSFDDVAMIAVGFVAAFVSGLFVVQGPPRLRLPPRLLALRLVADRGRRRRACRPPRVRLTR